MIKNTYLKKSAGYLSMNVSYRKLKIKKYLFLKGSSFWASIPIISMNTSE